MAWIAKRKRLNKKTNKTETYYAISWRQTDGRIKTKGLGFCTAKEAKRALKVVDGRLAAGLPVVPTPTGTGSSPAEKDRRVPTLERYLRDTHLPVVKRDKAHKTFLAHQTAANALIGEMGTLKLTQVTFARVDKYITARKKLGRRSRTIIIELRTLKAALQHALDSGVLTAVPRLPTIKDTDRKPHRFLTEEEAVRLLKAIRPPDEQPFEVTRGRPPIRRDALSYLVVLMALNTGMRKTEMLTRGFEDIRWNQGTHGVIVVCAKPSVGFQVKTRRDRVIPLTPELRKALERTWEDAGKPKTGWIFPSPVDPTKPRKDFKTALKRACERAGLPHIHPHGLRHTWASRLAMKGVDRKSLMTLGGWKEGRMLDEVYAHVTNDHLVDIMGRMGLSDDGE